MRRADRAMFERGAATPKRFALLCQHFYPEMVSTGMHMTELATRLAELGWEIDVYTAKPSWGTDEGDERRVPKEMKYQGVRIFRVPSLGSQQGGILSKGVSAATFAASVSWTLWRRRGEHPGLVVTTNPPFIGILGWLFSRLYGRPYLVIVYDVFPEFAVGLGVLSADSFVTKAWAWVTRQILSGAAVNVVIGRDMQDLIRGKVPAGRHDRIVLIPNWSDERRVHPVLREANAFRREHALDGRFVVQYGGRLGEKHNLEPLLDAARLLRDTSVLFQFVGEGAKKPKLQAMVARYGLTNVQFLPYQPMSGLAEMLSAPDLAVVCLESGHTGISVPSKTYGVIAAGTPILAMLDPAGEIAQMIKETDCGVVVDPNADDVARAIRELMADPAKLRSLGASGRRAFLDKYTLAHAADAYDAALSAMLTGRAI
jgi:glycosyltransferase involved in cell wall biosynthesis